MDDASKRLVDQRCRTRLADELNSLVMWEDTIDRFGFASYFNSFFFWAPDAPPPFPNSTMTEEEQVALTEVQKLMIQACDETGSDETAEEYAQTGWPQKIATAADRALRLMINRGRFSDDVEEHEPTLKFDGDWDLLSRIAAPRASA